MTVRHRAWDPEEGSYVWRNGPVPADVAVPRYYDLEGELLIRSSDSPPSDGAPDPDATATLRRILRLIADTCQEVEAERARARRRRAVDELAARRRRAG